MIINCFGGMVDQRKSLSLISSCDNGQRSSQPQLSDMLQAGFEPVWKLSSSFFNEIEQYR